MNSTVLKSSMQTFIKVLVLGILFFTVFCSKQKADELELDNKPDSKPIERPTSVTDSAAGKIDSVSAKKETTKGMVNPDSISNGNPVIESSVMASAGNVPVLEKPKTITNVAKTRPSIQIRRKIEHGNADGEDVKKSKGSEIAIKDKEPPAALDCYCFTGQPLTHQEALECAKYHCVKAKEYYNGNKSPDTAYMHCKKGLSLYENGSLFTIKADILNQVQRYSESVRAAEISISRNDHWEAKDKVEAYRVRCSSLYVINKRFPSTEALSNYKKAVDEFEKAGRISK